MFDLITGKVQHVPSTPAIPILVSTSIQAAALSMIVVSSLLFATGELPPVPDMMAFVGMPAAAAPPPPPPPPSAPATRAQAAPKPVANAFAAPVEAPPEVAPEPVGVAATSGDVGVPGGVEGGVPAGVVASEAILEGPPPPPPPVQHGPVQVGGQLQAPALIKRVEPSYPQLAQFAALDGVVILDAVVDERGHVQAVKVLRGHPLLAQAGTEAVQQWIYEPLRLNGTPTAFELTVTLRFHFDDRAKRHS